MISAVLFDLDETLLDRTRSLVAFLGDQHRRFGNRLGRAPFAAWRDRFLTLDARGHVDKSVVYPAILSDFGGDKGAADALLADYRKRCCHHAEAFPGMADTLRTLRARGLRLGVVTNGETEFQMRHVDALGLRDLVDCVLVSQAEGMRKPEADLFLRAVARLAAEPDQCLFVGDNPVVDVLGAHAAGLRTAWFGRDATWPRDLPPAPGAIIDALPQVLDLVAGREP